MKASVVITLKNGVLDPQGKAVEHSLHALGHTGAADVRIGKYVELDVDAADAAEAKAQVEEMCRKLLANPVIEDYCVTISD